MKRKEIFLSLFSGFLLALTPYPVSWKYLVWVALVPLLHALESSSAFGAFVLGVMASLPYFSFLLGWIPHYNVVIFFLVLPCALLFLGAFSFLTHAMIRGFRSSILKCLAPALVWAGLQYVYGLTPLGSMAFDLEVLQGLPLLQFLALSGVTPLTFLFLLSNGLIAYGLLKRDRACFILYAMLVLCVAFVTLWGHFELSRAVPAARSVRVACVQPNFPISEAWRSNHREEIFDTYREMILEASRAGAQLIVLPQYTLPVDVYHEPAFFEGMARAAQAYLVLGTYTLAPDGRGRYNIALVFSPDGKLAGEYRAVRPPPFRRIGQVRGSRFAPVETSFGKVGILLCYEDAEPEGARELVGEGAEILVTLMNNGHFKKSRLLHLHLTRDIFRAVETHRCVVRCATTGISALIDARGRVLKKSPMEEKAIITGEVLLHHERTLFTRYGDVAGRILAFAALIFAGFSLRGYNFSRK